MELGKRYEQLTVYNLIDLLSQVKDKNAFVELEGNDETPNNNIPNGVEDFTTMVLVRIK